MKLLLICSVLIVTSCVSYPRQIESVEIDYGYDLPLIKNSSVESFSALQELTVKQNGREFSFKVQIEVVDSEITVIGLTPVHSRSFLISYKDGMINYEEHPFFRYPLSPEQMIADIQMGLMPINEWRQHLMGSKISVIQKDAIVIFQGAETILVKVIKNKNSTRLIHCGFNCEIIIKNLSYEKL